MGLRAQWDPRPYREAAGEGEAEDHSRPYSDQEIVEKLREEHGIRLARRTVAKYREELQILPARLRKR